MYTYAPSLLAMAMLASVGFSLPVVETEAYTTVVASTVWNTHIVTVNPCEATYTTTKVTASAPVPAADTSAVSSAVQSFTSIATPSSSSVAAVDTSKASSTIQASSTSLATSTIKATSTTPTTTALPSTTAVPSTTKVSTTKVPSTTAAPSTTVASTSSAAASSTASSSSGSKRGLPYTNADLLSAFTSPQISWIYNWGTDKGSYTGSFEYIPMLWGSDGLSTWAKSAQAAIDDGCTALLGFNEPDLPSQANMDYATAAQDWVTYMNPFAGKATLVSPAVTNSIQSGQGLAWLSSFLSSCSSCHIDVLSLHWYGGANATDFKQHVTDVYNLGNKEKNLWVTEFAVQGASDDEQASFLEEVLPWLDSQAFVERYAFFGALQDILVSDAGVLTSAGTVYNKATA